MCGIAGFISSFKTEEHLIQMTNCLVHRGPDSEGYYYKNGVGLGHRRLSILDLSVLGNQPYRFENLVLIYNGEVFNYVEIRQELIARGYSFASNSDTEVVIKSFHCWREQSVQRFIGMFAFAIYDEAGRELFLFRDRVGIKPLYYSLQEGISFGSELKSILRQQASYSIDPEALYQYHKLGYITDGRSIYQGISKLPPGNYLHYHEGRCKVVQYWDIRKFIRSPDNHRKDDDWADELEELLISAFKYRTISDVPVGLFLSGGIDSSLVAAILQKHGGNLHTFTLGFNEPAYNEAPFAKAVAECLGTVHTEEVIDMSQAQLLLPNLYSIYDEPFSDSSAIPMALVSHMAARHSMKVVLSADGGDELFCGYNHYKRNISFFNTVFGIPKKIRKAGAAFLDLGGHLGLIEKVRPFNFEHRYYTLLDTLQASTPRQLYEVTRSNQAKQELKKLLGYSCEEHDTYFEAGQEVDLKQGMMLWDFHKYLPDDILMKVDRATMYYSLEGREPFLDHRVMEFAAGLPFHLKYRDGKTKFILRKILSRYMPEKLFDRPKHGFNIPIYAWFRRDLRYLFDEYLSDEKIAGCKLLNPKVVKEELAKFKYYNNQGKQYNIEKMWRLLSFMMWYEKWGNNTGYSYSLPS